MYPAAWVGRVARLGRYGLVDQMSLSALLCVCYVLYGGMGPLISRWGCFSGRAR